MEKEPMKKCPFCAELIKAEAVKCRYCGSMLNRREFNLGGMFSTPGYWHRVNEGKKVAGVCTGIAEQLDSPILILPLRIFFVLTTLFYGFGVLVYIVLWVLMPPPVDKSGTASPLHAAGPAAPPGRTPPPRPPAPTPAPMPDKPSADDGWNGIEDAPRDTAGFTFDEDAADDDTTDEPDDTDGGRDGQSPPDGDNSRDGGGTPESTPRPHTPGDTDDAPEKKTGMARFRTPVGAVALAGVLMTAAVIWTFILKVIDVDVKPELPLVLAIVLAIVLTLTMLNSLAFRIRRSTGALALGGTVAAFGALWLLALHEVLNVGIPFTAFFVCAVTAGLLIAGALAHIGYLMASRMRTIPVRV